LLISSGLGGRFPFGYPVAMVDNVKHDPGQPFAEVTAKPSARLSRSRQVILISHTKPVDAESIPQGPKDLPEGAE